MLRVARRAIRQFYKENVISHKGRVITSEAQLAVIFSQRVVDKVRTSLSIDSQQTHAKMSKPFGTARTGPLASSHEHPAGLFEQARWKLPSRIGYFTLTSTLDSPGPIATYTEVPQSPLAARPRSPASTHLRRQSRVYVDAGPLRRQLSSVSSKSLEQVNK